MLHYWQGCRSTYPFWKIIWQLLNPRILRRKDQIHDYPIKASCIWGCTQEWSALCFTVSWSLRERPLLASWSPFNRRDKGLPGASEFAVCHTLLNRHNGREGTRVRIFYITWGRLQAVYIRLDWFLIKKRNLNSQGLKTGKTGAYFLTIFTANRALNLQRILFLFWSHNDPQV